MRLPVLVRTPIFFLVGICACLAISQRNEEPKISSRSVTRAPDGSNSYVNDKINESRGFGNELLSQASKPLLQASHSLEVQIPEIPLHDITIASEQLGGAVAAGEKQAIPHVISLLENEDKTPLFGMETPWNDDETRKSTFNRWLKDTANPDPTFRLMKVNLKFVPGDMQSIDPKLLWWLEYITGYKNKIDAITAKSNTATKVEVFGDKELFNFLVDQYGSQLAGQATSSAVVSPSDSHQHVVDLFELLRRVPTLKKLTGDMQRYLVSNPETSPLMMTVWLKDPVSPSIVFNELSVGRNDGRIRPGDDGMFSSWLVYVQEYWMHVKLHSVGHYFSYSMFLKFLEKEYSPEHVLSILCGSEFRDVYDKVPTHGFENLANTLLALWMRWLWRADDVTPRDYLSYLSPTGKFELGSSNFLQGILYIDLYQTKSELSCEDIFNLLIRGNTVEEIRELFLHINDYVPLQGLISHMLEYISNPSIVVQVAVNTPTRQWRLVRPKVVLDPKDDPLRWRWSRYAKPYSPRVIGKPLKPGNSHAFNSVKPENMMDDGVEDVSRARLIESRKRVRNELAEVNWLRPDRKPKGKL